MDDLKWFIGIMGILFIGWLVSGGPARTSSLRPFIKPLPPVDSGAVYGPPNLFGISMPVITIHPAGWQALNTKYFILYAPSGWSVHENSDTDNYTGTISNGNTTLSFEYGDGTNPLEVADGSGYTTTYENISTYNTKIIYPTTGRTGTTGAYYKKFFKKYTLTITGENLSASERTTVLNIFRSVRFKIYK
jgi:hypothetical protein